MKKNRIILLTYVTLLYKISGNSPAKKKCINNKALKSIISEMLVLLCDRIIWTDDYTN